MRTFTGNSVGDTATYTCDPGFQLIGDPTTTCTAAVDGNSATYPAVPPPECNREYFMNITRSDCTPSQLLHVSTAAVAWKLEHGYAVVAF